MKKSRILTSFPQKRFIKLLSVTKQCPLSLEDRLVYSLLAFSSVKKIRLAKRQIARRLRLDKDTVGRAIARLAEQQLVDLANMTALVPDEDREDWFVRINRSKPKWQEQLGYLPIPLPQRLPPGITWRTLAVHSFLFSRANAEGKAKTCAAEIARILRLDARTVRKSLNTLEGKLLIELDERRRLIRVDMPDQSWLDFFQDQKQVKAKPLSFSEDRPWEDMTDSEINAHVYDPSVNTYTQILRKMRYLGRYSTLEMQKVRAMVRRYEIDHRTLSIMYNDVQKTHEANQKVGSFGNSSSFSLLNYRIGQQYASNVESS